MLANDLTSSQKAAAIKKIYQHGGAEAVRQTLRKMGVPEDAIVALVAKLKTDTLTDENAAVPPAESPKAVVTAILDVYDKEGVADVRKMLQERGLPDEDIDRLIAQLEAVGEGTSAAVTFTRVGVISAALGMVQTALAAFEQGLVYHRELKDHARVALTLEQIGNVWQMAGRVDLAFNYYYDARPVFQVIQDRPAEARIHFQLANLYMAMGDHESALQMYEDGLPLFAEVGNRELEGSARWKMHWLIAPKDLKRAITLVEEVVEIFEEIDSPSVDDVRARLTELRRKIAPPAPPEDPLTKLLREAHRKGGAEAVLASLRKAGILDVVLAELQPAEPSEPERDPTPHVDPFNEIMSKLKTSFQEGGEKAVRALLAKNGVNGRVIEGMVAKLREVYGNESGSHHD